MGELDPTELEVIFLDPPAFSRSKRMEGTLDIQRDHVRLLELTMGLLDKDGTLIFSNNLRRFRLDEKALGAYLVEDITASTIPRDFARNPKIHNTWRLRWRPDKD